MRLGILILLAMLVPCAFAGDPPLVMRYEDGLLTAHVEHVPLDQVIERLEKETDSQFHGTLLDCQLRDAFLRTFFLRARTQAQQDRAVRSQQSHG